MVILSGAVAAWAWLHAVGHQCDQICGRGGGTELRTRFHATLLQEPFAIEDGTIAQENLSAVRLGSEGSNRKNLIATLAP